MVAYNKLALRPFIPLYGGKYRAAPLYPSPLYPTIVEPFSGGAGYSLHHYARKVFLYDVDEKIYGVWSYLINVKMREFLRLPSEFETTDDLHICQEAKWLIGYNCNPGSSSPRKKLSTWGKKRPWYYWDETKKQMLASQLKHIRHWKVFLRPFHLVGNKQATWFVDPPYEGTCGKHYNNFKVDYQRLSKWCQVRSGQVIVCEREGASWLPFQYLAEIQSNTSRRGKGVSKEVAWISNS